MITKDLIKKLDDLNIVEEYKNKTYLELEKEFNISHNLIWKYLKLKGVESRKPYKRKTQREIPPIGKKFGLWTVISTETKSGSELNKNSNKRAIYWKVRCECGCEAWKNSSQLKNGTSTRCKKCGNKTYITDDGEIIIESILLSKFRQIAANAKKRKKVSHLDFNITPEYLHKLYNKDHHCALSGIDLTIDKSKNINAQNISVDRIDSNVGYIEGNIELVDKRINLMKGCLSNEEFVELCCKVAEYHGWSKCG